MDKFRLAHISRSEIPPLGVGLTYVGGLQWLSHNNVKITVFNYLRSAMSTGYQIADQTGSYFLTFQVVDWVDIFSRKLYRDIIIDSLDFCRKNKRLQIWAYVIMTNHVQCILSATSGNLSEIVRDFKRHTASKILKEIKGTRESRKDWMLKRFEFAAKSHKRNRVYQFWTHENHAVELISHSFTLQKMAYSHENPVRSGWVENAEDWMYSSQRNYSGLESLIEIDLADI